MFMIERWCGINEYYNRRKRGFGELPSVMEEDLRICTVRPANDSDRRFCFEVISPTK